MSEHLKLYRVRMAQLYCVYTTSISTALLIIERSTRHIYHNSTAPHIMKFGKAILHDPLPPTTLLLGAAWRVGTVEITCDVCVPTVTGPANNTTRADAKPEQTREEARALRGTWKTNSPGRKTTLARSAAKPPPGTDGRNMKERGGGPASQARAR